MYCLHPRVIALSILPVIIMGALSLSLGYFYWESALMVVRSNLESYELVNAIRVAGRTGQAGSGWIYVAETVSAVSIS